MVQEAIWDAIVILSQIVLKLNYISFLVAMVGITNNSECFKNAKLGHIGCVDCGAKITLSQKYTKVCTYIFLLFHSNNFLEVSNVLIIIL